MPYLGGAEDFIAIRTEQLKPSVRVPGIGEIAQMIGDAVVEQRNQRAKRHAGEQAAGRSLDGIGRLFGIHAREPAIRHLSDDSRVHEEKRSLSVAAEDRESRLSHRLSVDDVGYRIRHAYGHVHRSRVLRPDGYGER